MSCGNNTDDSGKVQLSHPKPRMYMRGSVCKMTHQRPVTNHTNLLIITCHDLGRHLGCYGQPTVNSPNLDHLAEQGVRLTDAFCVAPQCSPSRAAMFTGRYPHCNGVMGLTHADFAWDLAAGEKHLANILRDAGWHTASNGNTHEGRNYDRLGFVERLNDHYAPAIADGCAAFINRDHGRPFYLQVGFFEPHRPFDHGGAVPDISKGVIVPPYLVDDEDARREVAAFQGAIRMVDAAIGQLLAALDRSGKADNTLVLFTTDHGIPFPRAKCSLYEPGLGISLILRWPPARWRSGSSFPSLLPNIDILPTLLELLELPIPAAVQGRSFAPLLRGDASYKRNEFIFSEMTFHTYTDPRRAVRNRTHKLIVNFSSAPVFMDPSQSWRPATITRLPADPSGAFHVPIELYDLRDDPLEHRNLAEMPEHRPTRDALLARLHRWMHDTADPLLSGIPMSPIYQAAMAKLRDSSV
jgi:N-sulfoglucosamine sulfohydrolase